MSLILRRVFFVFAPGGGPTWLPPRFVFRLSIDAPTQKWPNAFAGTPGQAVVADVPVFPPGEARHARDCGSAVPLHHDFRARLEGTEGKQTPRGGKRRSGVDVGGIVLRFIFFV